MKKGPLFEKQVVEYEQLGGFPDAHRRLMGGSNDRGDVGGVPRVVQELKNRATIELSTAVKEAEKEAKNANALFWAVVFKRRQKPVENSYVIMDLEQWVRILKILHAGGWLD